MFGPGSVIGALENPQPRTEFPVNVRLTGEIPVLGGGNSVGARPGEADEGIDTRVPPTAPSNAATTARTAMRAWFPIIAPPRTPRSLHHVERGRHRVMVQAAELRAPDRVIAGLERLEPVRVRVSGDDVDLEQEIRKVERVRDVEGTKDEFDRQTRFHAEGAGCVQRCERPRAVEPRAVPDVGDVEVRTTGVR